MAALRGEQPPASNGPREPERTTGLALVSLVLADWWRRPLPRSFLSPIGCRFPPLLPPGRSCWGAAATSGSWWRRAAVAALSRAAPRHGPWSATAASCPRRTATRSKPPPPGRWPGTGVFSLSCCPQNSYPGPPRVEMGGTCSCHPSRGGSFGVLAIIKGKLNVKQWKIIVIKMLQYQAFSSS